MQPSRTGPFPYIPINKRPPLKWSNGAYIAVWVVLNVECFALNEKITPQSHGIPDVPTFARREYGARVGVWRQMEVLERLGIRATVALNSEVCDVYPDIVEEGAKLGWEFIGHSESNTRPQFGMPPNEERRVIFDTRDRIEEATGVRPVGWLGAALQETWNTLDFLAEAGFRYVGDWVNDDQPYLMDIGNPRLVSVPYDREGDKRTIEAGYYTTDAFEARIRRQFDVLYREGKTSGRVMAISLHPYITGEPHRIDALESALSYISNHEQIGRAHV